jgi:adenylate cyclase
MTLRKKTLLIIALTLGILFLFLYVALSQIMLGGFAEVEGQVGRQNVQRVLEAYNREIEALTSTAGDWAPWDDSYAFIQDKNEQYIAENLTDPTFINLRLNMMLFFDKTGQLVYGKAFDLAQEQGLTVPDSLIEHFAQNDQLFHHTTTQEAIAGIILLPESPLLVASYPIVTSAHEGPIQGSLIMGRYLDESLVELLESRTQFPLAIYRLDDPQLINRYQAVLEALTPDTPLVTQALNAEQLAGYTLIKDVYGKPALLLEVMMPRPVYTQSRVSLRTLMLSLVVLGLVFILLTLFLLEKLVLARLAQLHTGVREIGTEGDLSRRLTFPGEDELSGLAAAINQMLTDLQSSLQREKMLRQEVQRLQIEIDQVKREQQVNEITETEFFRELQAKAQQIRRRSQRKAKSDEEGSQETEDS